MSLFQKLLVKPQEDTHREKNACCSVRESKVYETPLETAQTMELLV